VVWGDGANWSVKQAKFRSHHIQFKLKRAGVVLNIDVIQKSSLQLECSAIFAFLNLQVGDIKQIC
jgi:hypothetical protein